MRNVAFYLSKICSFGRLGHERAQTKGASRSNPLSQLGQTDLTSLRRESGV